MLRFYGVPILASPVLSFPLSDERKSGFLPPSFGIDSRSGFQAAIPYYWNIAPNRDATFTRASPALSRGPALDAEFRYLEPSYFGAVELRCCRTTAADRSRYALPLPITKARCRTTSYAQLRVMRVSDDDYWKDFPGDASAHAAPAAEDLLLSGRSATGRPTRGRMRWQVLQTEDPTTRIISPYERRRRSARATPAPWRGGFEVGFEAEFNRFANPDDRYLGARQTGDRTHALGSIARPFFSPGWTADAQGLVQRGELLASTCRSPTASAAPRG